MVLTGFLAPYGASIEQRIDDAGDEEVDEVGRVGAGDDEKLPEKAFAKKAFFPSSMGLSLLVNENTSHLNVTVGWGDYFPLKDKTVAQSQDDSIKVEILSVPIPQEQLNSLPGCWKRVPHEAEVTVTLEIPLSIPDKAGGVTPKTIPIPDSNGLQLVVFVRAVTSKDLVPAGTLSVSVFLVNNRLLASDK